MTDKEIEKIIGKEPKITSDKWADWVAERTNLILFGNSEGYVSTCKEDDNIGETIKPEPVLKCNYCGQAIEVSCCEFDKTTDECVDLFVWKQPYLQDDYSEYLRIHQDIFEEVKEDLKKVSKIAEKCGINTTCYNLTNVDGEFYDDIVCPECGEKIEFVRPYLFLKSRIGADTCDENEADNIDDTVDVYHLYKMYEDFMVLFVFPKIKTNTQLYNKLVKLGFKSNF